MRARGEPGRRWTAAALLLIAGYCIARYRDAVLTFFFLDDFWLLRDAAMRKPVFGSQEGSYLLYRPLTQRGYFALLRGLFGSDASAFHAVELLAFAATAMLVFLIARRLTQSIGAALAASLLYATAPGHAVAVFWVAAFSMTGSALVVLGMLWAWLRLDPPEKRMIVCATLQLVGLLCSEHAVTAPVLLLLVAWASPREEPWRQRLRLVAPCFAAVAVYVLLKVAYLVIAHPPRGPYSPSFTPVQWLTNVGHYALGCAAMLKIWRSEQPGTPGLFAGLALVLLAAAAAWRSREGAREWRLLAAGVALFIVALVPVVVLPAHFYDYFVGIAALGFALALVAACLLAGRRAGSILALGLAASFVLFDAVTAQRAARADPIFRLVQGGAGLSAQWLAAVGAAVGPDVREVAVKREVTTDYLFSLGHSELVFPAMPPKVSLFPEGSPPPAQPGLAIVFAPAPHLRELPGWSPSSSWLRTLAR